MFGNKQNVLLFLNLQIVSSIVFLFKYG